MMLKVHHRCFGGPDAVDWLTQVNPKPDAVAWLTQVPAGVCVCIVCDVDYLAM